MLRTLWTFAVLAVVLVQCASGCGGSSKEASTSTRTPAAAGPIPPQLVGTYTTKLSRSDLPPNPPPELTHGSNGWTLQIVKTGAVNNGPGFAIVNDRDGELETSPPSVSGDRIPSTTKSAGRRGRQCRASTGTSCWTGA